ncbi:MAG TPA: DUF4306 domain-containing protein [Ureibacillus sp.]|nr:DUF4306 domain-containing protein [Ureibacillus sp.]
MFKYIIHLLISLFVFVFATLSAWYEGSAIIENQLEWSYSTPFTHFLGIDIITGKEIVVLDYFVYATKFQPLFPLLMYLSIIYILALILVKVGKANIHLSMKLAFGLGILLLLFSTLCFNATSYGGVLFYNILLISAMLTILLSMFFFIQSKHKEHFIEANE